VVVDSPLRDDNLISVYNNNNYILLAILMYNSNFVATESVYMILVSTIYSSY
jgi:hypothetical protein